MRIVVVGIGYVGLSNALLLAQHNCVYAVDVVKEKVDKINQGISPIKDSEICSFIEHKVEKNLDITATVDATYAYTNADIIIIATPTNYDVTKNYFDTSSVENVLAEINKYAQHSLVVIKSTIPIGFTEKMADKYSNLNILFMPEFLREGKALYDNLYPSRIIVGVDLNNDVLIKRAECLIELMREAAIKKDIKAMIMQYREAESVKLFANSYLAMRVAFFNELDTFAENYGLKAESIINGVCLDPRIGDSYNNPSFGYGGYCLPKDTKQLLANYVGVPQSIIHAIVDSNKMRKDFVVSQISKRIKQLDKKEPLIGIYRLTMKTDSDNFRQSSMLGIIKRLQDMGVAMQIYEPTLGTDHFQGCPIINSLDDFKKTSDLIISNRYAEELSDINHKLYTRDVYRRD